MVQAFAKNKQKEQFFRKSTYPPPADGPGVLFLCKFEFSANNPATQAGRGALQPIAICTECKVLTGNERGCTAANGAATEGVRPSARNHWAKTFKTPVSASFQKRARSFGAGIGGVRGEAEFSVSHGGRGL